MLHINRILIASFLVSAFLCGCSGQPSLAIVDGVVLVSNQPGTKIRLEFHPNELKGTRGPFSFAETDAEGHFKLVGPVAVGWHKVIVQDLRFSQSETGRGITVRFGPEYAKVLTTPLDIEVKAGEQTITIDVPKK